MMLSNDTKKIQPVMEDEELTERLPADEKELKDEQEGGIMDLLVKSTNPKLAEIPRVKDSSIARLVIISVLLFLIVMTWYAYWFKCDVKIGIVDADWYKVDGGLIEFHPYNSMFGGHNTYICASYSSTHYIYDDGTYAETHYTNACLLGNMTYEDYDGVSLAYLFSVQLASMIAGHCMYHCCFSKNEETPKSMMVDM